MSCAMFCYLIDKCNSRSLVRDNSQYYSVTNAYLVGKRDFPFLNPFCLR